MPPFSVRCSTRTQSCSRGERVGQLAGAVRRAVIDDKHAEALGGGACEHLAGRRSDRLDVLGLVVGGQYQPGLSGHGSRTLERGADFARYSGRRVLVAHAGA